MKLIENLMVAKEAVNRIDCILKELPQKETINSENPKDNSITFKNVSFIYPGNEQYALSQVSFSVADGETVALVGPSGSGKSTIASLIPRFFDVTSGKVEVGGVDVCNIKKEDLMNRVSFVFQNTRLLKASILDNVRIAKPEASVENIMKALENAQCMDIINKFPEGVHTVIGGAGVYLSGGECQRIALARAILKDSPIVVLDEATAFADPENEWKIQKALAKLTKGKTVLMVAHRLSTIQRADKILVLKEGKLREHGTHDELVIRKGIYSKMWCEYTKSVNWKIEKISDSNRGNEVLA
jgi:ATP-binding cassette subfamily B protein